MGPEGRGWKQKAWRLKNKKQNQKQNLQVEKKGRSSPPAEHTGFQKGSNSLSKRIKVYIWTPTSGCKVTWQEGEELTTWILIQRCWGQLQSKRSERRLLWWSVLNLRLEIKSPFCTWLALSRRGWGLPFDPKRTIKYSALQTLQYKCVSLHRLTSRPLQCLEIWETTEFEFRFFCLFVLFLRAEQLIS